MKKKQQAALVLALVIAMTVAGSFAWSSLYQSRVNTFQDLMTPDVNLHDDFEEGPNKDVYVENSGWQDLFVRVRLTEYLQTKKLGSLVAGHSADRTDLWAPHNGAGGPEKCDLAQSGNVINPTWSGAEGQDFHDFYTWTMGGQIYYKPAPEELRAQVDEEGNIVQEAQVVCDELTKTEGDAAAYYAEQLKDLEGDDLAAKMEELGVKRTLEAQVYTMDQWKKSTEEGGLDYARGDFWVIDTDGWAYWANPLHGGDATGLLLDRVDRTDKQFDSDAEYSINVQLQAVTAEDIAEFGTARGAASARTPCG